MSILLHTDSVTKALAEIVPDEGYRSGKYTGYCQNRKKRPSSQ